jgi:2-phosphosulfolactate phosphatase
MKTHVEVLFSPAEFAELPRRDLSETVCVVFDVLRATSSMVTALAHSAEAIIPVAEIAEAVALRERYPGLLLAGERQGVRIRSELTGGPDFDLGNSPREFTAERVGGRTIAMTTTNGTRALRASAGAATTLVASFLNLETIATAVSQLAPRQLLVVCSGTFEEAAYEDALGAGALVDALPSAALSDSALMVRKLFQLEGGDVFSALKSSRNGARLWSNPELKDDVLWCAKFNAFPVVARLDQEGRVRRTR